LITAELLPFANWTFSVRMPGSEAVAAAASRHTNANVAAEMTVFITELRKSCRFIDAVASL